MKIFYGIMMLIFYLPFGMMFSVVGMMMEMMRIIFWVLTCGYCFFKNDKKYCHSVCWIYDIDKPQFRRKASCLDACIEGNYCSSISEDVCCICCVLDCSYFK